MAQKNIDFGTFPDDPNADAIRTAFQKVQENFTDLYSGLQSQAVISVNRTPGAGLTVNSPTGNVVMTANIACVQVHTSTLSIGRDGNGAQYASITQSSQTLWVDLPDTIANVTNANFAGTVTANYVNSNIGVNTANLAANSATIGNATANTQFGNGTIVATGNANVGNLGFGSGAITGTGNITAGNIIGAIAAGSNNITTTGNVTAGNVYANSGIIQAQYLKGDGSNITGVVAVTGPTIANGTSNVNIAASGGNVAVAVAGAIKANFTSTGVNIAGTGNFTGNVTAANFIGNLANGNSNVTIPAANGQVDIYSAGNLTLAITGTGANITGTANISGNANVGNIGATNGVFTNVSGNGSLLTALNASSITSGTLSQSLLANSSLTVNGTSIALGSSGTVTANTTANLANGSYITGGNFNGGTTTTWAVDATTAATASKIVARDANANIAANYFIGNGSQLSSINASSITSGTIPSAVSNNISNVGTVTAGTWNSLVGSSATFAAGLSGANLTSINASGITSGTLAQARLANSSFTINGNLITLGGSNTITAANPSALTLGSGLTGTSYDGSSAVTTTVDSTTTATASKIVARDANANIAANYFIGNGSQLSSINASSITSGTIPSTVLGNSTIYIGTTAIAGNRASGSQTLTGVSIDGSAATATSATTAGTVTTPAQPAITSVGLLTGLTVGNNTANTQFGNGTINATGNANVGNLGFGSGVITGTGNITAGNIIGAIAAGSNNITTTGNISGGNLIGTLANGTSNVAIPASGGNVNITAGGTTTLVVTATGANITGTLNTGTGVITGIGSGLTAINASGITTGTLAQARLANSTFTINGNLITLGGSNTITANTTANLANGSYITGGNFNGGTSVTWAVDATTANTASKIVARDANGNVSANYFIGNGSQLTGITVSAGTSIVNGTSNVSVDSSGNVRTSVAGTANVMVVTATGANITGTANISGNANVGNIGANNVVATSLSGTVTTASQTNITTLGALTGLTVNGVSNLGPVSNVTITGGSANYFLRTDGAGNLTWINATTLTTAPGSNTQVLFNDAGSFAANANLTFNKTTGNLTVGGGMTVTGNLSAANITGVNNLSATNITGTLTSGPQTGISAVGSLTALTVTGTAAANNVNATNYANAKVVNAATGTITASNAAVNVTQTWNNSSATFTGIVANITDTASQASSLLLDLQVGGVSQANITKAGNINFAGTITGNGAGLTTMNASGITSGTLAQARLANSTFTINGTTVTLGGTSTVTANTTQALTLGSYLTGTSFNGSTAVTATVDATTTSTASKVVARDANANIYANNAIFTTVAGDGGSLSNIQGTVVSGPVASATNATTATNANLIQTNTSTSSTVYLAGTITSANGYRSLNIVSGITANFAANSITAATFNGNVAGNLTGVFSNASSNINIIQDGNINLVANSVSTMVVSNTGVTVSGTLSTGTGVITGNGSGLTALNATNVTAGTLAQARLANSSLTVNGTTISLGSSGTITANTTQYVNVGSYLTGANFNGGTTTTWAVDADTAATASKVVARDANANIYGNNFSGATYTSTVATGTAPFVVTSTTQVANLNVANAGYATTAGTATTAGSATTATSATTAGTVTTPAQPAITSVGTLTSLAVTGNVSAANFVGALANGTSNVSISSSGGNVNITSGGTTSLVVTNTGANVTGTLNVTANATFGSNLIMANNSILSPTFTCYKENISNVSINTSTQTLDLSTTNIFNITLSNNTTLSFINPPAGGTAYSFMLYCKQDATGGRTITWPAAVKWPNGSVPTLSTGGNKIDILNFFTLDGGTTYIGALSLANI